MVVLAANTRQFDGARKVILQDDCLPVISGLLSNPNRRRSKEELEENAALASLFETADTRTLPQNRAAFFARFDPWMMRTMRRYGYSADARQEIYGDLYCRFSELMDAYEPERGIPLMAYLYRHLSAFLYTHARGNWRRQRREVPLPDDDGAEMLPGMASDPTEAWDERLMFSQFRALLPTALRQLPAQQRRVLTWRYYEELSYEEIACRLRIQPSTARSLLRYGLKSVREWMRQKNMMLD